MLLFPGIRFFCCCCCSHLNLKPWCELSSAWNWPLGPEDMQQRLNTINLFRLKTYFLKISEGGHADSVLPQCDEVPLWMNDSKPGLIFTFDDLLLFFYYLWNWLFFMKRCYHILRYMVWRQTHTDHTGCCCVKMTGQWERHNYMLPYKLHVCMYRNNTLGIVKLNNI